MAGPKGQEKGTREEIHLRVGADISGFKGTQVRRDPSAIPPEKLQEAINARMIEGIICSRGGQEKVITSALTAPWDGLYDAGGSTGGGGSSAGQSLYLAGDRVLVPFEILMAGGEDVGSG